MGKEEASLARNVAEAAEEAARLAIERAQAVEIGLDQPDTSPNLERELEEIRDEADHAVQLAQETEQVAGATDQAVRSTTPQTVDDEEGRL